MTTLADLIAEVAAEHVPSIDGRWCLGDHNPLGEPIPYGECPSARLAAALSVENVAAGLKVEGFVRGVVARYGSPNAVYWDKSAAALLAAITVAT